MHVMYDSVDVGQIPANAGAVAGYMGGSWPTAKDDALRIRFPHAYVVTIAPEANIVADFLDVEQYDATPKQAVTWLKWRLAAGHERPGIYCDLSTMQGELLALLKHSGIPRGKYRLWVAAYNGPAYAHQMLAAGFGACQYADNALGRNLDVSLCKAGFFVASEKPRHGAPAAA